MQEPLLESFRLVGGTSLALQIGHRTSVDIDLFTDATFDKKKLYASLIQNFESFQLLWQNDNGFSASIDAIKIDVFNWRVRFIEEALIEDGMRLMHKREIGATKLETITDRKTKKDFCDLYFLLHEYSLGTLIESFRIKYPYIDYKFVVECLWLIDEADDSELPAMLQPFVWDDAKEYILSCLRNYWSELQNKITLRQQERLTRAEELLRRKKEK